jgi:hypothetical protein
MTPLLLVLPLLLLLFLCCPLACMLPRKWTGWTCYYNTHSTVMLSRDTLFTYFGHYSTNSSTPLTAIQRRVFGSLAIASTYIDRINIKE